jgi:ATP-dependent protease ClpP protease subunit
MSRKRTALITLLFISTIFFPFIGFFSAARIEDVFYEPLVATFVWLSFTGLGLCSLYLISRIAIRHYQFNCLKPTVYIAYSATLFLAGWITNGAWYDYYFFSSKIRSDFTIRQHSEYPNHFIFDGKLTKDAGDITVRQILNSEDIDLDESIILEINSNGGSPQAAILLAEFIKHYNVRIEVLGKCISACTLVLLSSSSRYIHPRAWVGFHASYMVGADNDISYDVPSLNFYDEQVELALREIGVQDEFITKSKIRDENGGFYPEFQELVSTLIINRFERTYIKKAVIPWYL